VVPLELCQLVRQLRQLKVIHKHRKRERKRERRRRRNGREVKEKKDLSENVGEVGPELAQPFILLLLTVTKSFCCLAKFRLEEDIRKR